MIELAWKNDTHTEHGSSRNSIHLNLLQNTILKETDNIVFVIFPIKLIHCKSEIWNSKNILDSENLELNE